MEACKSTHGEKKRFCDCWAVSLSVGGSWVVAID